MIFREHVGKLLTMFVAGVILSIIGYVLIVHTHLIDNFNNFPIVMIPAVAGGVLLMLSGYYGIRKFGRYMDKD